MPSNRTERILFFMPANAVENPDNLEKFKQKVLETAGDKALAIEQISARVYGRIVPTLALTIPLGYFGDSDSCNVIYDKTLRTYLQETLPADESAFFDKKKRESHAVFQRFVLGQLPGNQPQKIEA